MWGLERRVQTNLLMTYRNTTRMTSKPELVTCSGNSVAETLRHSRGMTLLCSRKATSTTCKQVLVAGRARGLFAIGQVQRQLVTRPGEYIALSFVRGSRAGAEHFTRLRRDDAKANRTPSAWMTSSLTLGRRKNSVPNRVPSVGHSKRAEVGHSWLGAEVPKVAAGNSSALSSTSSAAAIGSNA